MARFFALVLFVVALSSASAADEKCYMGDAVPAAGVCEGVTIPLRICDGGLGQGEAKVTALATLKELQTETTGCESWMEHVCPEITAAATGKTGADACGSKCVAQSNCNAGT